MSYYDGLPEEERNAYTVGELMDAISKPEVAAKTEDLTRPIEIGSDLLYEAIRIADELGAAEFFTEAFSFYGPLGTAALEEMRLDYRSTHDGRRAS